MTGYVLDEQIGFLLRQVTQRHTAIFAARIGADLTPMQWAVLAKLREQGACPQNQLGRLTAMDAATVKGVVDRLVRRRLLTTRQDPQDGRRVVVDFTEEGADLTARTIPAAQAVTADTLAPLNAGEATTLLSLLEKLR
jgi:DNA-binding MarR family transcriptional regulator